MKPTTILLNTPTTLSSQPLLAQASGYFLQLCECLKHQVQYRDQGAQRDSVLEGAVLLLKELRRVRRVPVQSYDQYQGWQTKMPKQPRSALGG